MGYGETIREARAERAWTEAELAYEAGVHLNTVWRTEREVTYPSLIVQQKLAGALGIPRKRLFPAG
jgi:transcriptional regulator with XRE-family HTH domain